MAASKWNSLAQRWLGVAGGALLLWDVVGWISELRWLRRFMKLSEIGQAVDFVLEHLAHPGWLGEPSVQFAIMIVALFLIYLDVLRARNKSPNKRLKMEPVHVIVLGLAITAGGVVWQVTRPSADRGAIVWDFEKSPGASFLTLQGKPGASVYPIWVQSFQIIGTNTQDVPITKFGGTIRSDTTNQTIPLGAVLRPSGEVVRPEDTNGIPAKAEFVVMAALPMEEPPKPGMSAVRFLTDFVPFTLEFTYDGKTLVRHFDGDAVKRQYASILDMFARSASYPGGTGPRVTKSTPTIPEGTKPP